MKTECYLGFGIAAELLEGERLPFACVAEVGAVGEHVVERREREPGAVELEEGVGPGEPREMPGAAPRGSLENVERLGEPRTEREQVAEREQRVGVGSTIRALEHADRLGETAGRDQIAHLGEL
ncbi:MAG TPA: hypothetical protein VHW23_30700, partial [Kofleriaceae bacterium]|nr:hypothetical protein [Kofleriaceae bacterium]